jgi:hypothetical protein
VQQLIEPVGEVYTFKRPLNPAPTRNGGERKRTKTLRSVNARPSDLALANDADTLDLKKEKCGR